MHIRLESEFEISRSWADSDHFGERRFSSLAEKGKEDVDCLNNSEDIDLDLQSCEYEVT